MEQGHASKAGVALMARKRPAEYDLYLDESGTFRETADNRSPVSRGSNSARFPSQLAGLLVERGR